ncbi:hypothetical protein [Borrelia duttonii]|uniref:Uncharacterized protein n=2 Tax=Borrelia TaxID=138 RepID=B5RNC6_BORDL|nr:hypothetical protein BDU_1066 [Borrelia duttonii Ly]
MDEMKSSFGILSNLLMKFKQELESKRVAFFSKEERISINFKGILNDIYYPSDLDEVYEALRYDIEIILSLGRVFQMLNFKNMGDRDTRIVTNLLNGLMYVAHSIQIFFEDVLNKAKLEMLKFRDEDDLEKITKYLVQFIDAVKDLMSKFRDVIVVVASKTNEDDILNELQKVIASSDSNFNKEMRNIHYILFDIIELVDLL